MDEIEKLRRDVEALHGRLSTLEQLPHQPESAALPAGTAPEEPTAQIVAFRAELARLAQVADGYAALDARVKALELRSVN